MRYLTTQEIKSETKVGRTLNLFDLFFIVVYMTVSLVLGNLVHPGLRVGFYIFSLAIAITLTMKSYHNKRRRVYESIFIMWQKDETVYYPVGNVSKKG